MIKRPAHWIVAALTVFFFTFALAPAQETPAPAEEAPPAEVPAEEPEAAAPDVPTPADEPATEPAPDEPVPAEPAPDEPAPLDVPEVMPEDAPAEAQAETQPTTQAATQPSDEVETDPLFAMGKSVLSERLSQIAQSDIAQAGATQGMLGESAFSRAAALLRAAARLEPRSNMVWHLLTEAELTLGNPDDIRSALIGYRKAAPGFTVPQIQFIELTASQMETGEQELAYLRGIGAKETIAPDVRAHAYLMAARRLLDRGEDKAAAEVLDEAVKLNPVNVAALDLKYQLAAAAGASMIDRATTLLALVRANPIRPDALGAFGRLLADMGMNKEAADWLNRAIRLSDDPVTKHNLAIDYAATEYIAGQYQPARLVLDAMIQGNPIDIDAWMMKLVMDRGGNDKDAYAKSREAAGAALASRWAQVARFVADEPEPTTQPTVDGAAAPAPPPAEPGPEPAAVAQQVLDSNDSLKQAAFISAAADYAWFEVYFNENPGAAAPWIEALESVVPEDNVTRQRLRGWMQLASQQPDDARQTLSAIRDSDPLAALGILRLSDVAAAGDKEAGKAADDEARKLLADYPSGLVGAIIAQALKDRGLKSEPHPDVADVRALVQKFPRGWLDMAEQPQRFYSIRVDPEKVAHSYGEPMYARVTLKNLTAEHIPIGDDGVIRPGLWFDAQYQVLQPTMITGVAFERITVSTVLPAGGSISQYVRLDQGRLAQAINSDPTRRLQITGWCSTNITQQGKNLVPGPAGARMPFAKKITRAGFQLANPKVREKFLEGLQQGLPDLKMRSLDLSAAYVAIAAGEMNRLAEPLPAEAQEPDPDKREQMAKSRQEAASSWAQMGQMLLDAIIATTEDNVPAVAQWASFTLARVGAPEQREAAIAKLLADERWEGRLLGVIAAAGALERERATELVAQVAEGDGEKEDLVRNYAAELHDWLQRVPATTQPADPEAPAPPPAQ